jgi:general L-amino acid transport system permease protein
MALGRTNIIVTIALGPCLTYLVFSVVHWAIVNAVWSLPKGVGSCREMIGHGACWVVITERFRFILFGSYPFDQQWRPLLACLLFVALFVTSSIRACWRRSLLVLWIVVPACAIALLLGGIFGLPEVPTELWGGLPLTFLLSTVGFAFAFPLAVALALGRRSEMPAIRVLSVAYIELVRGVPLITFLFMAAVMFPLFAPQGFTIDKLVRAQAALAMVMAAYLAEVIRAGLQAIPQGQYEAAASLGLTFWRSMFLVHLPQALRITIPALVNTFIAVFKDTSLVAIIGLFDLLGTAKAVIVDPKWVGFGVEVYLFVALVYFAFCHAVSRYSRYLERLTTGV